VAWILPQLQRWECGPCAAPIACAAAARHLRPGCWPDRCTCSISPARRRLSASPALLTPPSRDVGGAHLAAVPPALFDAVHGRNRPHVHSWLLNPSFLARRVGRASRAWRTGHWGTPRQTCWSTQMSSRLGRRSAARRRRCIPGGACS